MSSPIAINEIRLLDENLSTRKTPGSDSFSGEFYQTYTNSSKVTEEEITSLYLFYVASNTLVPKLKTLKEKKSIDQYLS